MTIWNTLKKADKNPPGTWNTRHEKKGQGHPQHIEEPQRATASDDLFQKQEEVLNSLMQKIEELKGK